MTGRNVWEFRRRGFTLVRAVLGEATVAPARAAVDRAWGWAKAGKLPQIRVYEDYPPVLGGVNVAGIEDPFATIPALKTIVAAARLDAVLGELTGWAGADLEVARVHVNDRFRYQGFWHRDARATERDTSVVAVVYLRDEAGFRIAPQDWQPNTQRPEMGDRLQAERSTETLSVEHEVMARAGDVLVMKSYLLHRGYCTRKRSHLHLRFVAGTSWDIRPWLNFRHIPEAYVPASAERRWKNLARYLVPSRSRSSWWQR